MLCRIHHADTARADRVQHKTIAEDCAGLKGAVVGSHVERRKPSRIKEFVVGGTDRLQHRLDLCAELRVVSAVLEEECVTLVGVEVSEREEDGVSWADRLGHSDLRVAHLGNRALERARRARTSTRF